MLGLLIASYVLGFRAPLQGMDTPDLAWAHYSTMHGATASSVPENAPAFKAHWHASPGCSVSIGRPRNRQGLL
jgi:hypothetical protein